MTWSAPAFNGGSAITGYQIYRGTSAGGETLYAAVGVVIKYKDTGATTGIRYYDKVVAINSVGAGTFSNEASAVAK